MSEIEKLRAENEALKEIMEQKQKTISVMSHDLLLRGVNFDFSKVEERWNTLDAQADAE